MPVTWDVDFGVCAGALLMRHTGHGDCRGSVILYLPNMPLTRYMQATAAVRTDDDRWHHGVPAAQGASLCLVWHELVLRSTCSIAWASAMPTRGLDSRSIT